MSETKELILIVDDDEELSDMLQIAVRNFGYEAHAEPNPRGARKWLMDHPGVLLIISDVMMPDGNGLDFCRWVRAEPGLADVPIILCTGLKDDETMSDALELGAVDFIRKPIHFEDLKAKIDRLRDRKRRS